MDNKRHESRLEQQETVFIEIQTLYEGQPQSKMLVCHSLDISATGIKVQVDEALHLAAIYQMGVEIADLGLHLYLAIQIKWQIAAPDGQGFWVGLEVLESDDTDLQAWKMYVASRWFV